MKILLFTDNHFSQYSSIIRSKGEKYSTRLENQIKSLNWVNEIAMEKNCSKMICLGDFFDKAELNAEELTALKDINWNNLPKYFLVGNHEAGSNDLTFNSINALSSIGTIIDKPTLLDIGFGYELFLLPYISEINRKPFIDYLRACREDYYNNDSWITQEVKETIVLSHNDISGIRYGQYESKHGFNVDEITRYCKLYINGHLHNQTQINQAILNLGNLTGQNFSEDGFKYSHCVAILDTSTFNIELINNPYAFNFYKISAIDIYDLETQIDKLNKETAVGTISIPEKYSSDARLLCKEYFKEFRLLVTPDNTKRTDSNILDNTANIDHIRKFKDFCLENIENNEALLSELALLN